MTAEACNSTSPPTPERPTAGAAGLGAARILHLRVPVVAVLAQRRMAVGKVRSFSAGSIIEFSKPVGTPLELCVNNARIGIGTCVKIGENFGLRLDGVESRAQRIESLGGK